MGLRPLKLPEDFQPVADVTPKMFHYPENSAWSLQTDEADEFIEATKMLKRIWPIIWLAQAVSPPIRDVMLGFVWEEDRQIVGTIMVQRRGTTDKWGISNVGVLPEFRRRGIARKLMEAGDDLIRERGGKIAILDVIDGNLPAIQLYENLGFEHFSGTIEFESTPQSPPPLPVLPDGYTQSQLKQFDWQPRFEMDKRISPESLTKYETVEVGRYRPPVMMRLLYPIISAAQRMYDHDIGIYTNDGTLVARGGYSVPKREKGLSTIRMRVDPDHSGLATYLVAYCLHHAVTLGPGKRIECSIPHWQEAAIQAVAAAGCTRRKEYLRMGLEL